MITRDEEAHLPLCLRAAMPLFDELCVVDTGSVDGTLEVLKDFSARLVHETWRNDFAWARNKCLALATQPWVIVLDADEIISPELVAEIRSSTTDLSLGALSFLMDDPQPNGHTRQTRLIRGWRNSSSIRYKHRIHEDILDTLQPFLKEHRFKVGHLNGKADHLGYGREVACRKGKKKRDVDLLLSCLEQEPDNLYNWFKLCEVASFWNDKALLRRGVIGSLPLLRRDNLGRERHILGDIAKYILQDADYRGIPLAQQCALICRLNTSVPHHSELAFLLGTLYERLHDLPNALKWLTTSIKTPSSRPNDLSTKTRAHLALARVFLSMKRIDSADRSIGDAMDLSPYDREGLLAYFSLATSIENLHHRLASYEARYGRQKEAQTFFRDALYQLKYQDHPF